MTTNASQSAVDQVLIPVDEAADILGVLPSVLEDLAHWGDLSTTTIEGELAISRATLDGLFEAGIGSQRGPGLGLDL